jgi:hypothetical protein
MWQEIYLLIQSCDHREQKTEENEVGTRITVLFETPFFWLPGRRDVANDFGNVCQKLHLQIQMHI